MKNSKKVFLALATIFGVFISTGILFILLRMVMHNQAAVRFNLVFMFLPLGMLVLGLLICILIGRFVYFDAQKRGMDPWLWVTVAIFIPNFIGLIIYLIVRNQYTVRATVCPSCHRKIDPNFNVCPYCGTTAKSKCPACGLALEEDWKHCPQCGKHL